MNKPIFLTKEGYEKLEKELEHLKTVQRKEVSETIKVALSFGDLSENSEYDEAKNQQAIVEAKILQIEHELKNANIIDEKDIKTDLISMGSKVEVKDLEFNEVEQFKIVSSIEADPINGKISDESPVGKALIDLKVGDIAVVNLPDDKMVKYEILSIGK
ncbi:MAG: transcription elongation factor GreA [Oscillospiraceae bacterium]